MANQSKLQKQNKELQKQMDIMVLIFIAFIIVTGIGFRMVTG